MENDVLDSLASQAVDRALARRRTTYADEVRRLVDAGFELIRQSGRLEPRVSEIVRVAGLSNQAFYRHFRSKDELLVTVLDEGIRQLAGYLQHRMARVDSPEQKIREWIAGLCEQALNPGAAEATRPFALSRSRLSERFPQEVQRSETRMTAILRDAIEAATEAGEFSDTSPDRDAAMVYGLAMGWMQQRLAQPEPPSREDAEHLIEFALAGLRGR